MDKNLIPRKRNYDKMPGRLREIHIFAVHVRLYECIYVMCV